MDTDTRIVLNQVTARFDEKTVFSDLSFQAYAGDRIAIAGPSGIGKSTLLRMIAGLISPEKGSAEIHGTVSFVFDDNRLYPLLSARENIELGVDFSAAGKKDRRERAKKWAEIFECEPFLLQKCSTLSAGQQKRISLARALMKEPQILLLDEAFHALDPSLRTALISSLFELQQKMGFILIFATHDLREAELLKAQVYTLDENGRLTKGNHTGEQI